MGRMYATVQGRWVSSTKSRDSRENGNPAVLAPANVNSSRIFWVPAQGRDAGWGQEQLTKSERLRMNQRACHDLV